jgi:Ala-tRNA(Pro) deacylase
MSLYGRLIDFVETQAIPYRARHHIPTYTAQAEASAEQLPGRRVAKVVVVVADGRPAMFLVPADRHVDLTQARFVLRRRHVRLARENELECWFPDCEVGAMPPFGNWYSIPVYIDRELAYGRDLTFYAGRHDESLTIATDALVRFSRATIASLTEQSAVEQSAA